MATNEQGTSKETTGKVADLPTRRVDEAKASQIKGGRVPKKPLQPCI